LRFFIYHKIKCKAHLTHDCAYDILYVKLTLHISKEEVVENKIKSLRQDKGISQEKLGNMLGVSRQTINSLEAGRYNPSIILAFKLAKVFDMGIEEIFVYKEEENE